MVKRYHQETESILTLDEYYELKGDDGVGGIANRVDWEVLPLVRNHYDSTADTLTHIKEVNRLLVQAAKTLLERAVVHDESKLHSPEKEVFDEMTPRLSGTKYMSDEYKQFLIELKPALDHHYAQNSHHPEYFEHGIEGMDLFNVIEMLLDWKASTSRTASGDIFKSIEINKERFKISDQLANILNNTMTRMGFLK